MTTPLLSAIATLIWKDLRAELRSRELVSAMALFTLLSVLVFSFALSLDRSARRELVSGVLWVTLLFASILGLNRSLAGEREQGSMDAMLIAPIDRTAIYLGKFVANYLFIVAMGVLLLPMMTVFYNINMTQPLMILTLLLGAFGLSALGTLLATMTVQTRTRETLLPIVMLPTALPILLTVVNASSGILMDEVEPTWFITLMVVDALFLALGILLFEYVVED
ncbi:MAG: heme exporter protein CcmB [Anaerolineae bacterium]